MSRRSRRATALLVSALALTVLGFALFFGETAMRAAVPSPHPENPYPLFAPVEETYATGLWLLRALVVGVAVILGGAAVASARLARP